MEQYYRILGVRINATSDEIKQAYRKMAKLYHPDINPSPAAKEMFIKIQDAYDVLLNGKPLPRVINPYPTSTTNYRQSSSSQNTSYKKTEKTYKGGMDYKEYKRKKVQEEKKQDAFNEVFSNFIITLFFAALVGFGGGLGGFVSIILIATILLSSRWFPALRTLNKFTKEDFEKCIEDYKNLNWAFSLAIPFYFLILLRLSYIEEITLIEIILSSIIFFVIFLNYFIKKSYTRKWEYVAISTITATNIYLYMRIMIFTF